MTRDREMLGTVGARAPGVVIEDEADEDIGVEATTLRDTRPVAAQKADWDDLREMVASWSPELKLDEAA